MRGQTYVILSIVFIIIVSIFAVTNVETVEVNYLFWSGNSPLILVILFSVLMGGIITVAASAKKLFGFKKTVKKQKEENEDMRKILQKNGLLEKNKNTTLEKNESKNRLK